VVTTPQLTSRRRISLLPRRLHPQQHLRRVSLRTLGTIAKLGEDEVRSNFGRVAARASLFAAQCAVITALLLASAPAMTRTHLPRGAPVRRDTQVRVFPAMTGAEFADRQIGVQGYDLGITSFPDHAKSRAPRVTHDTQDQSRGRTGADVLQQGQIRLAVAHSHRARPGASHLAYAPQWGVIYALAQRRPSLRIRGRRIVLSGVIVTPNRMTVVLFTSF